MNLEWTEEQKILRESVARFCKAEVPVEAVRAMADGTESLSDALWRKIADQAWLGVLVPEEYGGLGLGVRDLAIILEEMGRALIPGVYSSTVALGTPAIVLGGSEGLKSRWLERLGAGHVRTRATRRDGGFVLTGKKFFVPDLDTADAVVTAARADDGVTLFLVDTAAQGVSIEQNRLADATSRSGQLVLRDVEAGADSVVGEEGEGWEIVEQVLLVANVGIAAGSVAAAERVLDQAVSYARR